MRPSHLIAIVIFAGIIAGLGVYFYVEAQRQARAAEAQQQLILGLQGIDPNKPKAKVGIWIGAEECKTTFGDNALAFCERRSKDNSPWLDSGADAAVKTCFEYTARKLERPIKDARKIACEVITLYETRPTGAGEVDLRSSNYSILNDWVERR